MRMCCQSGPCNPELRMKLRHPFETVSRDTLYILETTDLLRRRLAFPRWAPVLLFSPWPIIAFVRGPFRRAARRDKGRCLKCAYNLEGNVSGVCSECGEAR